MTYAPRIRRYPRSASTGTDSAPSHSIDHFSKNAQKLPKPVRALAFVKFRKRRSEIVNVSRIRFGKRQTLETLIDEEALLLAAFLRGERKTWIPRVAVTVSSFV